MGRRLRRRAGLSAASGARVGADFAAAAPRTCAASWGIPCWAARRPFESLYIDNFQAAFSGPEQAELLRRAGGETYGSYLQWWDRSEGARPLQRLLYADMKTYLVELLMKQDQMSMSASIESRVPFLDHSFVEFAAGVPDHMKLRGSTGKYIFKKVAEQLIPHDIIYRKKIGLPHAAQELACRPHAAACRGDLAGAG